MNNILQGMTMNQVQALIESNAVSLIEALDFIEARVIKREAGFTKAGEPRRGSSKALAFLRNNGRKRPNDTTAAPKAKPMPKAKPVEAEVDESEVDKLLEQLTSLTPEKQDELVMAWVAITKKPKAKSKKSKK